MYRYPHEDYSVQAFDNCIVGEPLTTTALLTREHTKPQHYIPIRMATWSVNTPPTSTEYSGNAYVFLICIKNIYNT